MINKTLTDNLLDKYIETKPIIVLRDQNDYNLLKKDISELIDKSLFDFKDFIDFEFYKTIIKTLVASHDFPLNDEEIDKVKEIYKKILPHE